MAVNASAIWRARPSGSNTNGGGFDSGIGGAGTDYSQQNSYQVTGTNGTVSGTLGTSTTSNSIPTSIGAGNLTWTTSGSFGLSVGNQVIAYDTGTPANFIAGTVVSNTGTTLVITPTQYGGTGTFTTWTFTNTLTFVDATASNFTTAMVGNAIYIASGTGFITGWYFVTARSSATTVTLDRPCGIGSTATWYLGGALGDAVTIIYTGANTTSNVPYSPVVGGNPIYVLGSGTPNPSSYTYDYTIGTGGQTIGGNNTTGTITIANDPLTPGYKAAPDCTGGMPCVQPSQAVQFTGAWTKYIGIWVAGSVSNYGEICSNNQNQTIFGVVYDQFGHDQGGFNFAGQVVGGECFSSTGGSGGTSSAITINYPHGHVVGVNVHDCVGNGISIGQIGSVSDCIVAKCGGDGVYKSNGGNVALIKNLTIDANLGNGINMPNQNELASTAIINCIITNHTQAGKYGQTVGAGTATQNTSLVEIDDFNTYYGNTNDLNALNYGAHDTHPASSSPYVNQATENYTLA